MVRKTEWVRGEMGEVGRTGLCKGVPLTFVHFKVLHPYYKLMYIKLAWGGEKEQFE